MAGLFFLFAVFLEAQDFALDDVGQDDQADQVRDSHQGVEDIGDVPDQFQGLRGADIGDQREHDTVDDVVFRGIEQVLKGFFPVIFPAEDGGIGEQHDADGNHVAAHGADKAFKGRDGQGDAFQRHAVGIGDAQDAGRGNDQARNGADDDGIEERARHVDVALADRIIRVGSSRRDGRGAHAGFVGETAAGDAVADGVHNTHGNGAQDTAADGFGIKGHDEDLVQAVGNGGNIAEDAGQATCHVEDGHGGNQDGRNAGNGFDAAQDDDQGQDGQAHAGDHDGNLKGLIQRGRNGVGLGQVADAEGRQHSEEGEQEAQDLAGVLVLEAILHGVHGTAGHFALDVDFPILDGEHAFAELARQAEAGGNPHPDQGAGAAGEHGRRHADDVARADGGRQGRHQGGKRGNIPFAERFRTGFTAEHLLQGVRQVAPRQEAQLESQEHAGADQQRQHDRPPYETVDVGYELIDIHHVSPLLEQWN